MRPADRQQCASPNDRKPGVLRLDHLPPPTGAHRPEALRKKSRSTTNSPIFACSFSISAVSTDAGASVLAENTPANPSSACFFQPDQCLVHPVLRHQLRNRQFAADRLKRNPGLKIR